MNIVLKNLKIYEGLSEETTAFTADVYVNGKKVAYAKNDGHGGCTDYNAYGTPEAKKLMNEAEQYCINLPKKSVEFKTGNSVEFDQTLESVIDDLVFEAENAKAEKKLLKNMEKGICYGTPNSYSLISWKGFPIKAMLMSSVGKPMLIKRLSELKAEGKTILNTNIPKELYE